MIKKAIFIALVLSCTSIEIFSQNYLGLSANIGNRLNFSTGNNGFEKPPSISGSLFYLKRDHLKNDWVFDTKLTVGLLGYNLYVKGLDTLSVGWDLNAPTYFYETFYGQASLAMGKKFKLFNQTFIGGLGGGITYYIHSNAPSQFSDSIEGVVVFSSSTSSDPEALSAFAEGSLQIMLGFRFMVGLSYFYSFSPALHGTFEFFHTPEPVNGEFQVYQRELRISISYAFIKKNIKQ